MLWTIVHDIDDCHTFVHIIGNVHSMSIAWTDYNCPLTICPFALHIDSYQNCPLNLDLSTKILSRLIHFLGHCSWSQYCILENTVRKALFARSIQCSKQGLDI